MLVCPKCGAQNTNESIYCTGCGVNMGLHAKQVLSQNADVNQSGTQPFTAAGQPSSQPVSAPTMQRPTPPQPQPQYQMPPMQPVYNPYDHTSEFDAKDISDNKVFAMLPYLMGWIGIIVALLASNTSKYVRFHVTQAMKISVVSTLNVIVMLILCWTFVVPIACGILGIILWVVNIIGFFSVCSGNAKELPIVRSLGFLR